MSGFWESCLYLFQRELPAQQFNTWIKPLRLEGEASPHDGLQLIAPNSFILKWVKERYINRIESHCHEFYGEPVAIKFRTSSAAGSALATQKPTSNSPGVQSTTSNINHQLDTPSIKPSAAKKKSTGKLDTETYEKTRLSPKLNFSNLVIGKANDLAKAAASQVANSPGGDSYNPLFIYGGVGLGKTHLIHAIGNEILRLSPQKITRYVHAEDYYTDVVRAYQKKAFDTLKKTYRSLDVLLVDDVQFFNGKNRTQEEFFFVFNALIESKKQIVITCDTYPKNINGLDDRLVTRFDCGLTVQIEPPETEMRVAILMKKAELENMQIDNETAFFIAKSLRSNVRELEGALNKVIAYTRFHNRPIDLVLAKEALKDMIRSVRNISIEDIQKTTADYYQVKVADFYSKKRTRSIARPRQIAMWLCKEITANSYPVIGQAFGGRDHTTVIHAIKVIDSLRSKNNELNHDLHVLIQVLRG